MTFDPYAYYTSGKQVPLIIQILNDYRARIDGMETALIDDMASTWLAVELGLQDDINALTKEIIRRQDAGEEVTEQILRKMRVYKEYDKQLKIEITKYNSNYAMPKITGYEDRMGLLGISYANDSILGAMQDVTYATPYWERINLEAVKSMKGFGAQGSPLRTLLDKDYGVASQAVFDSLVNSIARGYGVTKMASDIRDSMGMGLERATLIARTEGMRSYRTASTAQFRESGVVEGFWRIVKKPTACLGCLMRDGEWFELDEELTDHPRGKCGTIPAVAGMEKPYWLNGEDYFRALPPEEQEERMGKGMYKVWKDTDFDLKKLGKLNHDKFWGDSPRPATLKEICQELGIPVPKTPRGVTRMPKAVSQPTPKITPTPAPTPAPATVSGKVFDVKPSDLVMVEMHPDLPLYNSMEEAVNETLQEIDKLVVFEGRNVATRDFVIGLTQDPRLPVNFVHDRANKANGHYIRFQSGNSKEIWVNPDMGDKSTWMSTFAHEFGHHFDHAVVGSLDGTQCGVDLHVFDEFYRVVTNTNYWKSLETATEECDKIINNVWDSSSDVNRATSVKKYINGYLSSLTEVWARAFAQWVSTKSGNQMMIDGILKKSMSSTLNIAGKEIVVNYQWEPDDFIEVSKAIDEFFISKGMLK